MTNSSNSLQFIPCFPGHCEGNNYIWTRTVPKKPIAAVGNCSAVSIGETLPITQTPTCGSSGSLHYYIIITVVNISTLYVSGYGGDGFSNVSLTIYIAPVFILFDSGPFDFIGEPTAYVFVCSGSHALVGSLYVPIYMYNQPPRLSPHSPAANCIPSTSTEQPGAGGLP